MRWGLRAFGGGPCAPTAPRPPPLPINFRRPARATAGCAARREDLSIDGFMLGSDGELFEGMQSFDEADKRMIRSKILEAFVAPERFDKEVYTRFYAAWAAAPAGGA